MAVSRYACLFFFQISVLAASEASISCADPKWDLRRFGDLIRAVVCWTQPVSALFGSAPGPLDLYARRVPVIQGTSTEARRPSVVVEAGDLTNLTSLPSGCLPDHSCPFREVSKNGSWLIENVQTFTAKLARIICLIFVLSPDMNVLEAELWHTATDRQRLAGFYSGYHFLDVCRQKVGHSRQGPKSICLDVTSVSNIQLPGFP